MSSKVVEFIPADYTEFYRHYKPYLIKIMRSAGIHDAEVEDITHAILIKFIQHDVLKDFDPDYTTTYQGQVRTARFSTFLSGFVYKYLRHHKDMQNRRQVREPASMDQPLSRPSGDSTTLGEVLSEPQFLDVSDFELAHSVGSIRESIVRMGDSANVGKLNLLLFFDFVMLQVKEHGKVNTRELSELFGVSTTMVREWIQRLRPFFQEGLS